MRPTRHARAARAAATPTLLAVLIGASCATPTSPPPQTPPPPEAPDEVLVKTRERAFTSRFDVLVHEGRLFIKPRGEQGEAPAGWHHASPDGAGRLAAVSADGDNLLVVDGADRAFYAKLSGLSDSGELSWADRFGMLPWKRAEVVLPAGWRAFAISHRGPDAAYYEDVDGNRFPVSVGVSTLYVLDRDGRLIHYADPWLRPAWDEHIFHTPRRGRFIAESLSASASTLFVIDRFGVMYTRLADYDTSGENPIPGWYTYERGDHPGRRTLPGESWRRQPPVPGRITTAITILQTGAGNAARELRVAGLGPADRPGYWSKPIESEIWSFLPAPELAISAEDLIDGVPPPDEERLGPPLDRDYEGELVLEPDRRYPMAVRGFIPTCSPSTIEVDVRGARVRARLHTRRVRPDGDGALATEHAVVELLPPERGRDIAAYRRARAEVFGDEALMDVDVALSPTGDRLRIEKDGWLPGQLKVELRRVAR